MSKTGCISFSVFQDFHGSNNGGVLNVDDIVLHIKCSYFTKNSCQSEGGCLYCTNTNLIISKTTFTHCFSTKYANNMYGNAIYHNENNATIENMIVCLCSDSNEQNKCTDSSILFTKCFASIKFLNSSDNCGYRGAAGITIMYPEENSIMKYTNVINGRDESMIQNSYNELTVEKSNIIHCLQCSALVIFQHESKTISLKHCYIWDIGDIPITNSNMELIAFDTYCDKAFGDIKKMEQLTTVDIIFNFKCPIFSKKSFKLKVRILPFVQSLFMISILQ